VAREPDPEDSRAARMRLTPSGERAACRVSAQEEAFAQGILERLGAQRAREVAHALAALLRAVREATEGCCPGAFDHLMEGAAWEGRAPRRSRERRCCSGD
jgi:hypothetical protein